LSGSGRAQATKHQRNSDCHRDPHHGRSHRHMSSFGL
jgi:hypothetical protein